MILIDPLFYSIYKNTSKINKVYPLYYSVGLIILIFYINFLTVCIFLKKFEFVYENNIDKFYFILISIFFFRYFITNKKYKIILIKYEKENKNKLLNILFDNYSGFSFVLYLISLETDIFFIIGIVLVYQSLIFILDKFSSF